MGHKTEQEFLEEDTLMKPIFLSSEIASGSESIS